MHPRHNMRTVVSDEHNAQPAPKATMDRESMSLTGLDASTVAAITTRMQELHPAVLPDVGDLGWSSPPYVKLITASTEQPAAVTTPVGIILIWFGDGKLRVEFSAKPGENAFLEFAKSVFGPDGLVVDALESNYKPLVGSSKLPGVSLKKIRECIDRDLRCGAGQKPAAFPQPFKERETDDGVVYKYAFTHYLSTKNGTRAGPEVPPEVAEAFKDMPDHPVVEYFRANPGAAPNPPPMSVANKTGRSYTAWDILAKISKRSKKGYFGKCVASVHASGLGFRYASGPNVIVSTGYINGPNGIRVYANMKSGADQEATVDPEDDDVYNELVRKRAGDDDVYSDYVAQQARE